MAACDLAGSVQLGQVYAVNSTAVKADGTRKSQTAVAATTYTLPFYPRVPQLRPLWAAPAPPAANGCCSHDGCSYSAWLRAAQTSLQVPSRARPADLSPLLSSPCSKPTLSNLVTVNSNTYTVTVTPDTTAPLVSYPNLGWDVYEILPQVGGLGQGAQYCT